MESFAKWQMAVSTKDYNGHWRCCTDCHPGERNPSRDSIGSRRRQSIWVGLPGRFGGSSGTWI